MGSSSPIFRLAGPDLLISPFPQKKLCTLVTDISPSSWQQIGQFIQSHCCYAAIDIELRGATGEL